MKRPWTTWLAWGLVALVPPLLAAGFAMRLAWGRGDGNGVAASAVTTLAMLGFAVVGALIVTRIAGNALGWIFISIALLLCLINVVGSYADQGLIKDPGSLPAALAAGWLYMWLWFPAVALIVSVPLLYPTGDVPGLRWRWVTRALVVLVALSVVGMAVYPGPVGDASIGREWPPNPLGVEALHSLLDLLQPVVDVSLALLVLLSLMSVVVRFRRSAGDERQQLKLMLFSVAVMVSVLLGTSRTSNAVADFGFAVATLLLPVAVGVAMLKYRLYDVDRIISKTLVYGALTVVLAAAYIGLVLAGQALFSSFAGGSNLAIAASTLVVAALFFPVRSRVQHFVDRRFYRRRYDAQRTLEGFGARLREQVELETLSTDLALVVQETIQPSHVSLWLRGGR